jgi:hypothetical protein
LPETNNGNGVVPRENVAETFKTWRREILERLPLDEVYGDILTGRQQGEGWLEARDPASPTGDRTPSAGVADGTGDTERGRFKSFVDGRNLSVFDYLVQTGKATDLRGAEEYVAKLTGVPLPQRPPRRQTARQQDASKTPPTPDYQVELIDSATFAAANYKREWLVRRLLVSGQPAILGGPKKSLKTSLLVDLGLSLGTGTPFLGEFAVPARVPTGFLSGESGTATLQETARRVAAAKGIDLASADMYWGFRLPQLADGLHLLALKRALQTLGVRVLLLDPLYLCLLSGVDHHGPQSSNLYQMGPLLMAVSQACLSVGCTPVLAHHFKLTRPNPYGEPQLEDLAYSGIQEFARQWVLLGRRNPYEAGSGLHQLWMSVGGSVGHSGLWGVDIEEGVISEDFTGRTWTVRLVNATEIRTEIKNEKTTGKVEAKAKQDAEDDDALLVALDRLDKEQKGISLETARAESRLSRDRLQRTITRLKGQKIVKELTVTVTVGNGAERPAKGVVRDETEVATPWG